MLTESPESRALERLLATFDVYSGQLEKRYRESLLRGQDSWRILRYERVTRPELHTYPIALKKYVRPQTFEKQLRYLISRCRVVSLKELLALLLSKSEIPPHTVALTFDNGWVDNFTFAFPLLQRYRVPATIFLATAYIGTVNTFWPEKLTQAILYLHQKGIGMNSFAAVRQYFTDLEPNTEENYITTAARCSALVEALKYVSPDERQFVFDDIAQAAEKIGGLSIERSFVTWEEAESMQRSGLIDFGTQGASHQIVSELADVEMAADVMDSISRFREKGIEPIKAYAFPEGISTEESRQVLLKMGIQHALGIGYYQHPESPSMVPVLSRLPVFEAISFCRELFARHLWNFGLVETTHD